MGKIIKTLINRFDGGISEDKRAGWVSNGSSFTTNKFVLTKQFDNFTYPTKLVPYNSTDELSGEDKTLKIVKFLYGKGKDGSSTSYYIYGLGINTATGTDRVAIYQRKIGATAWTNDGAYYNTSPYDNRGTQMFFYYKGYIYMMSDCNASLGYAEGQYLIRYDALGLTNTLSGAYQLLSANTITDPVHHPADDCAYFFANNKVYRLNNTTWDGLVLTLPDNLKITSCTPYQNYLAIGCATINSYDTTSIVFLWDRDSSLETLTDRIDFGAGELKHLFAPDNKLIGIVDFYVNTVAQQNQARVFIKQANGATATIINTLTADAQGSNPVNYVNGKTKAIQDNKLYFPMQLTLDGDPRRGIWVIDGNGRATIAFSEVEVDASTAKTYEGIFRVADQWWIAHSGDGSTNTTMIDGASSFASAYYDSLIFNAGDSSKTKKLIGITVITEEIPTGGSYNLYYTKDTDTSSVVVFQNTTVGSTFQSAVKDNNGDDLPEFKEIRFRIIGGGVKILGLKFICEVVENDIYDN